MQAAYFNGRTIFFLIEGLLSTTPLHRVKYVVYAHHLHVDSNLDVPFWSQNASLIMNLINFYRYLILIVIWKIITMSYWLNNPSDLKWLFPGYGPLQKKKINLDSYYQYHEILFYWWYSAECDRREVAVRCIVDTIEDSTQFWIKNHIKICMILQCGEFCGERRVELGVVSDHSPHSCY